MINKIIVTTFVVSLFTAEAVAQDTEFVNPCSQAPFTDFDFWVNDWIAFDFESGVVMGTDNITKINNGCTIFQDWKQLTDRFRAQDAPYRYAGISVSSVLSDGTWQQTWVGNAGGTIQLANGRLNAEGKMVFETAESQNSNGQTIKQKWYWDPEEDGSVHSWGEFLTKNQDGSWSAPTIVWNIRYVAKSEVGELVTR